MEAPAVEDALLTANRDGPLVPAQTQAQPQTAIIPQEEVTLQGFSGVLKSQIEKYEFEAFKS